MHSPGGSLDGPRPVLPEAFSWRDAAWGATLVCDALEPHAHHGWTTRALRLEGEDARCAAEWEALAEAAGVGTAALIRPRQVHGAEIAIVERRRAEPVPSAVDAVATGVDEVLLTVRVADCVPILLADPGTGAVAAIHAGWRGTNAGIAQRAVERMAREFGSRPADLIAGIGPSIGACCYRVGAEVHEAFSAAGWAGAGEWFDRGEELRLDLWRANRDQLVEAGLHPAHVHIAALCTACHPRLFYSYRRDGKGTGRLIAFIRKR